MFLATLRLVYFVFGVKHKFAELDWLDKTVKLAKALPGKKIHKVAKIVKLVHFLQINRFS